MTKKSNSRRSFIKKTAITGIGLSFGMSAKSYSRIVGANKRLNIAHAGLNGRMAAHLAALEPFKTDLNFVALCDVDNRTFGKLINKFPNMLSKSITTYEDYRKMMDNKDIDAITIASPDHWHTPMAIMAMNAGKHVYLEKPCSHNAQEGEWLVQVQQKTNKVLQIGNQQRSAPTSINLVEKIKEGIIGEAYYAKAFYENNRASIGTGVKTAVPSWLNWDLYQGPAPRQDYKDNIVHYNWHWFWNWGTGEISNNGLHEMDIARWALGVDIPEKVTSSGGRFAYKDDWQFWDTQIATFKFPGDKLINWEGRSCNSNSAFHIKGRGTQIFGTKGSAIVDRSGFEVFDEKGNSILKQSEKELIKGTNTVGMSGLDAFHFNNFLKGIRDGEKLNSPVGEAHKSTLLCHLGNMAQKLNVELTIDTNTGKPSDPNALNMWGREYENGWKPVI